MDNHDIDRFFEDSELNDSVERHERSPNVIWQFQSSSFPMFIQTQENVNRMRIVAYVAQSEDLDDGELTRLLEANYHSALDVRYALTDGYLVSAFIHPLRELTLTQFLLGLHQTIECAETWGATYSGGTLVFGASSGQGTGISMEQGVDGIMDAVVDKIRRT